jgi:hypothetical protein
MPTVTFVNFPLFRFVSVASPTAITLLALLLLPFLSLLLGLHLFVSLVFQSQPPLPQTTAHQKILSFVCFAPADSKAKEIVERHDKVSLWINTAAATATTANPFIDE